MSACPGSYTMSVREHPGTKAAECSACGRRFDKADLAGEMKVNVPLHSPNMSAVIVDPPSSARWRWWGRS